VIKAILPNEAEKYLHNMAQSGFWGDGIVLSAAAILFHHSIDVYIPHQQKIKIESDNIQASCLNIGFINNNHYVSLEKQPCTINDVLLEELPVQPEAFSNINEIPTAIADFNKCELLLDIDSKIEPNSLVISGTKIIPASDNQEKHATDNSSHIPQEPIQISFRKLPSHIGTSRKRKFCDDWYVQFPWLHWQGDKLLCHFCARASRQVGLLLTKRIEETFSSTGYSCNWRKAVQNFKIHAESDGHQEACEKLAFIKTGVEVMHCLQNNLVSEQTSARIALRAICTTLLTLAQTGCAVRGHDDASGNAATWLATRAEDIPQLKHFLERKKSFMSHDIHNELLTLMSNNILRQILKTACSSQFFSVIVDETTDIATKEQVSVCIRYLSNDFQPIESFLGLYQVNITTGENLTKVLLDVLSRCNLPLENLRGQCYDGASNMSGQFSGVQSRIKALQPRALYVHCKAHALNLVLQEAAREIPVIRDSMDYLHRTAILLGKSAKRKALLENLSANIKTMCPTRWAVRAEAVSTGLKNYEKILDALNTVATEASHADTQGEARGFYEQFRKSKMYWALLVAEAIFTPSDHLARALQSAKMTVNESIVAIKQTKNTLLALRCDAVHDDLLKKTHEAMRNFDLDLITAPRTRRPPKKIDNGSPVIELSTETYYRQQFFMVRN
jgi:hypothetical protein